MPPLLARALQVRAGGDADGAGPADGRRGDAAAGNAMTFNPKVAAAVIAGVVAFFTRSTLWTLGTGMAALWLLQAVG